MRLVIRLICLVWLVFLTACANERQRGPQMPNPDLADSSGPDDRDFDVDKANRLSFRDIIRNSTRGQTTLNVNKYLWTATLDVLGFLPVESADPFTGVIVTGYGAPPGASEAYRATIHFKDSALSALSLNIALFGRDGPVDSATTQAVERAIMARARQLRVADDSF